MPDQRRTTDAPAPEAAASPAAMDLGEQEPWVVLAWRAWLSGTRNWTALGRQFEKDRETVKRHVVRYSELVAQVLQDGSVDALAEYVAGLYEDLQDTDRVYRNSEHPLAKLGALNQRRECRKLLAAAKGVVTERKGLAVGQDAKAGPVQIIIGVTPATDVDEVLEHIEEANGNGHGADRDPDGVGG